MAGILVDIIDEIYFGTYEKQNLDGFTLFTETYSRLHEESISNAEHYIQKQGTRLWNLLTQRIQENKEKKLHPTFEVIDESRRKLKWYPYRSQNDPTSIKKLKSRLQHRGAILKLLNSDFFTDREYEAISAYALSLCGAKSTAITTKGNDFGIDFYSVVPSYGHNHFIPHISKSIKVLGQSKQYGENVPRDKVKLINDTLVDLKRKNPDITELLKPWFIASDGIIVAMVVGASGFQSGAIELAKNHGVVLIDNRDLAEVFALKIDFENLTSVDKTIDHLSSKVQEILGKEEIIKATPVN